MRLLAAILVVFALTPARPAELAFKKEGKGPGVVFIHGFGGNRGVWAEQVTRMKKDHTVLTVDLPGHGDSAAPAIKDGAVDLDLVASEVAALMRKQKVTPAVVVGHAMGGGIAVRLALADPGSVRGVVLVDSQLSVLPDNVAAVLLKGLSEEPVATLRNYISASANAGSQTSQLLKEAQKASPAILAGYVRAMTKDDLEARTGGIKVPVTLFASNLLISDPTMEQAGLMRLGLNGFPKLQVNYFVNAKHWVMQDEPDTFEVLFNDFEAGLGAAK
jgi:pimeloyl-ACP methyl ester carboxylesterase